MLSTGNLCSTRSFGTFVRAHSGHNGHVWLWIQRGNLMRTGLNIPLAAALPGFDETVQVFPVDQDVPESAPRPFALPRAKSRKFNDRDETGQDPVSGRPIGTAEVFSHLSKIE